MATDGDDEIPVNVLLDKDFKRGQFLSVLLEKRSINTMMGISRSSLIVAIRFIETLIKR